MGCCASTTNYKADSAAKQHHNSSAAAPSPPPPPEEETVKEVLSETPTPKPKSEDDEKKRWSNSNSIPALLKIQEEYDTDSNVDEKSLITIEVSEASECVSTVTEKKEDYDAEVRQRVDRSPAKFRNREFSGDRKDRTTVPKSPSRRYDQSPDRVRSVPGIEGRGVATDGKKRDFGESSGRRSSSPAEGGAARTGLGRSPSGRITGKSPDRTRSDLREKTRKVQETRKEPKRPPPRTNESLENPLVSLECFIFL